MTSTEKFELVLLRKLRYPLVPSYTRIVPGREGFDLFELRWTLQEQISCFGEKFFEPCRRNDFHQPGHFVCWIPERVWDSARLQDVLTWARQENFVADSSSFRRLPTPRRLVHEDQKIKLPRRNDPMHPHPRRLLRIPAPDLP